MKTFLPRFNFYVLSFLLLCATTIPAHAYLVTELQSTYQSGQVFLTWKNSTATNLQYNVYRSTSPLTSANINSTTFLGYVRDNSGKNTRKSLLYGTAYYFKITATGIPLASDRGLYVATSTDNTSYYYAVTITNLSTGQEDKSVFNASNSLTVPVAETIADPEPVLQFQSVETDGTRRYEYAMWGNNQNTPNFPAFNNAGSYAHNFTVFKLGNSINRSIYIQFKDDSPFTNSGINICTDCNVIKIDDRLPNGIDSYWSGWNENYNMYSTTNPVATTGVVKMFTQVRLKETIEWLRKNISADSNRVYTTGVSHNGFGALLTSEMWPNLIAATFANKAPIILKPINNSPREQQWSDNVTNPNSDYLDPNTGIPIPLWKLFDFGHMHIVNKSRGMPFVSGINGKQDATVGWVQKYFWYDSVNVSNEGGTWFWDNRTHNGGGETYTDVEVSPKYERFSLGISYPAFSYCSINQNPGNGQPSNGATIGALNGYLDWLDASVNDKSTNYDITCFVKNMTAGNALLAAQYDSCTTNITFRRLQQFKPVVGQVITWSVRKNNGNVVQQGTMTYNGGAIKLTAVKIYRVGSNISLSVPGCTTRYYADVDHDGYGSSADAGTIYCSPPLGLVTNNTDCNDNNVAINPLAQEVCDANHVDEDCDGLSDDADPSAVGKTIYFPDSDHDSYGSSASSGSLYCNQPLWYVTNKTDCNDANSSINPGGQEICDANDLDEDCDGLSDDADASVMGKLIYYVDADHDGYGAINAIGNEYCNPPSWSSTYNTDCNDQNADVNPGTAEVCSVNLVDEDCDGLIDDDDPSVTGKISYYADVDLDGYGTTDPGIAYCHPPAGLLTSHSDCNDNNAAINPGMPEICDLNHIDENCNGLADNEDAGAIGKITYYKDVDLDGYGDLNDAGSAYCDQPAATTLNHTDCDDANASINPSAIEICNANHEDDDCDGLIDSDDPSAVGLMTYYTDADNDGFGSSAATGIVFCDPPAGFASNNTDCDDANSSVHPGATEICDANSIDENCNGLADDTDPAASGKATYYTDQDNDGYGSSTSGGTNYCHPPAAMVQDNNDCDDANAMVNPSAIDICDGIDNNCDGVVDENEITVLVMPEGPLTGCKCDSLTLTASGTNISTYKWYKGNNVNSVGGQYSATYTFTYENTTVKAVVSNDFGCSVTSNIVTLSAIALPSVEITVLNNGNLNVCSDEVQFSASGGLNYSWQWYRNNVSLPGETLSTYSATSGGSYTVKVINSSNCSKVSEVVTAFGEIPFYTDEDHDGYGSPFSSASYACTAPSGMAGNNSDCNDFNAAVNPGAAEICNSNNLDEDCDGLIDNDDPSANGLTYYTDSDNDGYGASSVTGIVFCVAPAGYVTNNSDCNDDNNSINPGALEICDANYIDENCNGLADDADPAAAGKASYYIDSDNDGYGSASASAVDYCHAPAGFLSSHNDCSDNNAAINPGAADLCDGIDNNCNGIVDENAITVYVTPPGPLTGCKSDFVTLTASGTNITSYKWYKGTNTNSVSGASSAAYVLNYDNTTVKALVSNVYGCSATSNIVTITSLQLPTSTITVQNNGNLNLCAGVVTLSATGGTNYAWQWFKNDIAISGATTINYSATSNGAYTVKVTNVSGCFKISNPVTVFGQNTYYTDADLDGYGSSTASAFFACIAPLGMVTNNTDCNDANIAIHPGAQEVCDINEVDEDCNSLADDADYAVMGKVFYYTDADNDGYGNAGSGIAYCKQPAGSVTNNGDCNDNNSAIHPGLQEICDANDVDEDCNGLADDADSDAMGKNTYFPDNDLDGFGNSSSAGSGYCHPPAGQVTNNTDCNDANQSINPGVSELCDADNVDENCNGLADNQDPGALGKLIYYNDQDGDGYGSVNGTGVAYCDAYAGISLDNTDCNDAMAAVHPGAPELCDANNLDEDCNGLSDDQDPSVTGKMIYYSDADNDGFGSSSATGTAYCDPPILVSLSNTDCNDSNGQINPAATEICDINSVDENCNGLADDNDVSASGKIFYYPDEDHDGYGSASATGSAFCHVLPAFLISNTDCNDGNEMVNPGMEEIPGNNIDDNCDGIVDSIVEVISLLYYTDADMDGFGDINDSGMLYTIAPSGKVLNNIDCNDAVASINPAAIEICDPNKIDENCNGLSDDLDISAIGKLIYYEDADHDNFGNAASTGIAYCNPPSFYTTNHTDCNDDAANINPGTPEICDVNNVDENCNGLSDDQDIAANGKGIYYADVDQDGFGNNSGTGTSYCDPPAFVTTDHTDCNDNNTTINPSANEICDINHVDEDCDGLSDEADPSTIGKTMFYTDEDQDGFGASGTTGSAWCIQPAGKVSNNTDCNDGNNMINPAGTEICDANDADEDCDGLADDADPSAVGKLSYYTDADNDGYGVPSSPAILYCNPPLGFANNQNDCNDANPSIHPNAPEFCDPNNVDENCNGLADNNDPTAIGKVVYYVDGDGDSYGSSSDPGTAYCIPPVGVVTNKTDCADNNASIKPGATEICDGIDNNCNGQIDEGLNPSNPMPAPVITPVGSTSFCYDVSVTLNAQIGFNTYTWSNGKVGQSVTANTAGPVTVTVKDANNCYGTSAPVNLTVWEPGVPTVLLTGPSTYCLETPSLLSTIPGYNYQWKKGSAILSGATNQTYAPISTGTNYKVTISDTHGCTKTSSNTSITVNSATVPVISLSGSTSICVGQSATLTATAGFNSYLWSNGQTGPSISVSAAGNYTVSIFDQKGCTATSAVKSIIVNSLPQPVITTSGPTSFCNGGSVTLDAGTGYTSYNWSNGKNTQTTNITTSGSYSVTVTNTNNCSGTSAAVSVIKWVPDIPTIVTSTGATTFCANTGVYLSTISGFSYQWSKSSVDISGATAQTFTPTSGGSYKVTVTDAHGCSEISAAFSITILSNPFPVISGPSIICNGSNITLTCGSFAAYLWSNGSQLSSINPATAGDYTVTVTDANGCKGTSAPKTTSIVPLPTPVISAQGPIQFCDGGTVTLDAGGGYNTYSWSNGKNTQTNLITASGSFSVTVTNANGCAGTSGTVNVDEWIPPTPVVTTSTGATIFCANAGVYLTTIGGYSYQWQKTSVDITGATSQNYTPTSGGSYKVIITDIHGCSKTATALSITLNTNPVPVISGSSIVCQGSSVTLTCGTYSTYTWSTGSTAASITTNSSGTYTVTVTDANNCPGTSAPKITTLTSLPTPVITAQSPIQFCDGGSVTLDAGSGYNSYNWSNSKSTQTNVISASGTFTVTVTNSNGCAGISAPITVDEWIPPTPTVSIVGPSTFCANSGTTYLTTLSGPYTYQWIKGSTDQNGATNQNYTPSATASYKVKISDVHSCSKTSSTVSITVNSAPAASINISGSANICSGQTKTITANTGAGLTYQWKREGSNITGATASSYVAGVAGNYICVVTNTNGCVSTSNIITITSNCKDEENFTDEQNIVTWLLYPNPTNNDLHIRLNLGNTDSGKYDLEIRNIIGGIVWHSESSFAEHMISEDLNMDHVLAGGVYLVMLNVNGNIYHSQFVLTRK